MNIVDFRKIHIDAVTRNFDVFSQSKNHFYAQRSAPSMLLCVTLGEFLVRHLRGFIVVSAVAAIILRVRLEELLINLRSGHVLPGFERWPIAIEISVPTNRTHTDTFLSEKRKEQ